MNDGQVSITATVAWALWAMAGVLLAAAWAASESVNTTTALCSLAIIFAAAAATIHTRSFFCQFARSMREAFELGKETGRAEASGKVPFQRIH